MQGRPVLNKKYLFFVILMLSIIAISWFYIKPLYEVDKLSEFYSGTRKIEEIETRFRTLPTLKDAMFLIDKYNYLENYNKAIYYGNWCIDHDVNSTSSGVYVNFWMAEIYLKFGKFQLSRKYLTDALLLDKNDLIMEHNWIEKAGLQRVFQTIQLKDNR
jgi:hypothetical protein